MLREDKKMEEYLRQHEIIDERKLYSQVMLQARIWLDYKKMLLPLVGNAYICIYKETLCLYGIQDELVLLLKCRLEEITNIVTKKDWGEYELSFQTQGSKVQCKFNKKKQWESLVNAIVVGGGTYETV